MRIVPEAGAADALAGGLLKGRQLALDSTLIPADAAMCSIVRRDTNQSYAKYAKSLAKAAGDKPTRAGAARVDRKTMVLAR